MIISFLFLLKSIFVADILKYGASCACGRSVLCWKTVLILREKAAAKEPQTFSGKKFLPGNRAHPLSKKFPPRKSLSFLWNKFLWGDRAHLCGKILPGTTLTSTTKSSRQGTAPVRALPNQPGSPPGNKKCFQVFSLSIQRPVTPNSTGRSAASFFR